MAMPVMMVPTVMPVMPAPVTTVPMMVAPAPVVTAAMITVMAPVNLLRRELAYLVGRGQRALHIAVDRGRRLVGERCRRQRRGVRRGRDHCGACGDRTSQGDGEIQKAPTVHVVLHEKLKQGASMGAST